MQRQTCLSAADYGSLSVTCCSGAVCLLAGLHQLSLLAVGPFSVRSRGQQADRYAVVSVGMPITLVPPSRCSASFPLPLWGVCGCVRCVAVVLQVIIVDEFTGRTMPGRRWSDGLHQAVEAKEGLDINAESVTLASVSYQAFFRWAFSVYHAWQRQAAGTLRSADRLQFFSPVCWLQLRAPCIHRATSAQLQQQRQLGFCVQHYLDATFCQGAAHQPVLHVCPLLSARLLLPPLWLVRRCFLQELPQACWHDWYCRHRGQ